MECPTVKTRGCEFCVTTVLLKTGSLTLHKHGDQHWASGAEVGRRIDALAEGGVECRFSSEEDPPARGSNALQHEQPREIMALQPYEGFLSVT